MEARIVPDMGLPFVGVTTRKLTRVLSPSTLGVMLALLKGYGEARAYLKEWRPDVAVGTGGYVAAATILAAARQGVPTVILSPDAVAGRTNRWLSRWATKVCTWLGSEEEFPAAKTRRTGLPIRPDVVGTMDLAGARSVLGLGDLFTVLVIGGSQGAQRVNELVVEAAGLLPDDVQILHQTGDRNFNDVLQDIAGRTGGARHIVRPYLQGDELPAAYRSADLLLCRCGVGMLAEGAANGLPMLMVPLPTAYADHQTHNARVLERNGGGVLLPQPELTGPKLAQSIVDLRDKPQRRAAMASSSRSQGRPQAADEIARIVQQL
jgi:UDP-N-acetylglucosamine--N-acetylmuramyl-(pentapeptide) pyrophosphoryl-undecaprenol N-acetylglucosamine transferase